MNKTTAICGPTAGQSVYIEARKIERQSHARADDSQNILFDILVQVRDTFSGHVVYQERISNSVHDSLRFNAQDESVQCSAVWISKDEILQLNMYLEGMNCLYVVAHGTKVDVDLGHSFIPPAGVTIMSKASNVRGGINGSADDVVCAYNMPKSITPALFPSWAEDRAMMQEHDAKLASLPAEEVESDSSEPMDESLSSSMDLDLGEAETKTDHEFPVTDEAVRIKQAEMRTWFSPAPDPADESGTLYYNVSVSMVENIVCAMGLGAEYGLQPHPALAGIPIGGDCLYGPVQTYFKALFGTNPGLCYKCLPSAGEVTHAQRATMAIRYDLSLCDACAKCGKPKDIHTFPRLQAAMWRRYVVSRVRGAAQRKGSEVSVITDASWAVGNDAVNSDLSTGTSSSSPSRGSPSSGLPRADSSTAGSPSTAQASSDRGAHPKKSGGTALPLSLVGRLREMFYLQRNRANLEPADGKLVTVAQLFYFSAAFPRELLLPDFSHDEFFVKAENPSGPRVGKGSKRKEAPEGGGEVPGGRGRGGRGRGAGRGGGRGRDHGAPQATSSGSSSSGGEDGDHRPGGSGGGDRGAGVVRRAPRVNGRGGRNCVRAIRAGNLGISAGSSGSSAGEQFADLFGPTAQFASHVYPWEEPSRPVPSASTVDKELFDFLMENDNFNDPDLGGGYADARLESGGGSTGFALFPGGGSAGFEAGSPQPRGDNVGSEDEGSDTDSDEEEEMRSDDGSDDGGGDDEDPGNDGNGRPSSGGSPGSGGDSQGPAANHGSGGGEKQGGRGPNPSGNGSGEHSHNGGDHLGFGGGATGFSNQQLSAAERDLPQQLTQGSASPRLPCLGPPNLISNDAEAVVCVSQAAPAQASADQQDAAVSPWQIEPCELGIQQLPCLSTCPGCQQWVDISNVEYNGCLGVQCGCGVMFCGRCSEELAVTDGVPAPHFQKIPIKGSMRSLMQVLPRSFQSELGAIVLGGPRPFSAAVTGETCALFEKLISEQCQDMSVDPANITKAAKTVTERVEGKFVGVVMEAATSLFALLVASSGATEEGTEPLVKDEETGLVSAEPARLTAGAAFSMLCQYTTLLERHQRTIELLQRSASIMREKLLARYDAQKDVVRAAEAQIKAFFQAGEEEIDRLILSCPPGYYAPAQAIADIRSKNSVHFHANRAKVLAHFNEKSQEYYKVCAPLATKLEVDCLESIYTRLDEDCADLIAAIAATTECNVKTAGKVAAMLRDDPFAFIAANVSPAVLEAQIVRDVLLSVIDAGSGGCGLRVKDMAVQETVAVVGSALECALLGCEQWESVALWQGHSYAAMSAAVAQGYSLDHIELAIAFVVGTHRADGSTIITCGDPRNRRTPQPSPRQAPNMKDGCDAPAYGHDSQVPGGDSSLDSLQALKRTPAADNLVDDDRHVPGGALYTLIAPPSSTPPKPPLDPQAGQEGDGVAAMPSGIKHCDVSLVAQHDSLEHLEQALASVSLQPAPPSPVSADIHSNVALSTDDMGATQQTGEVRRSSESNDPVHDAPTVAHVRCPASSCQPPAAQHCSAADDENIRNFLSKSINEQSSQSEAQHKDLTALSTEELWDEFYRVRKELAQVPHKSCSSADSLFSAMRDANSNADRLTKDFIEAAIAEIRDNVLRIREQHPEDFFGPSPAAVPLTDGQLDSLLAAVTAPPSLQEVEYILRQLFTSFVKITADSVVQYYLTSFDPVACDEFTARQAAIQVAASSSIGATLEAQLAASCVLTNTPMEELRTAIVASMAERFAGFDTRTLKRLLARCPHLATSLSAEPALLIPDLIQQLRRSYWDKQATLKFDLAAEVKRAAMNLRSCSSIAERLYVIGCGFQVCCGYRLHLVQLTALAVLIMHPEIVGRLLQVLTGEGKSNIIVALAVYLVKCGDPDAPFVDIVTTHNHLAKRDAEGELKQLFDLFGVTVAHIIVSEEDPVPDKARPEYLAHVVFGTLNSFVDDVKGQRGARPFAYAIADEVTTPFSGPRDTGAAYFTGLFQRYKSSVSNTSSEGQVRLKIKLGTIFELSCPAPAPVPAPIARASGPTTLVYPMSSAPTESALLEAVALAALRECAHGRPVLIICQSGEFAEKVFLKLNSPGMYEARVALATDSSAATGTKFLMESSTALVTTVLNDGGVCVSLTEGSVLAGGLHVICTFAMPKCPLERSQVIGRVCRGTRPETMQVICAASGIATEAPARIASSAASSAAGHKATAAVAVEGATAEGELKCSPDAVDVLALDLSEFDIDGVPEGCAPTRAAPSVQNSGSQRTSLRPRLSAWVTGQGESL